MEVILLWKKMKKKIWFLNISEYHLRTMGLVCKPCPFGCILFLKKESYVLKNTSSELVASELEFFTKYVRYLFEKNYNNKIKYKLSES